MMDSQVEMRPTASLRQTQRLNASHDDNRGEEAEEEESSSLLASDIGGVHHPNNGHRNRHRPSSSSGRTSRGGGGGGSSLFCNDLNVCSSAWNRLSCPTRSILSLVVGVLLITIMYEYGIDEGVREQERDNSKNADDAFSWKSWRVFGGDDAMSDDGVNRDVDDVGAGAEAGGNNGEGEAAGKIDNNNVGITHSDEDEERRKKIPAGKDPDAIEDAFGHSNNFSRQTLLNTRARAQHLISTLHEYYGGEERAEAMLAKSWLAQWQLDDGAFDLIIDGDDADVGGDDDDDDEVGDDNGNRRRQERHLGNAREERKKQKKAQKAARLNATNGDTIDNENKKEKKISSNDNDDDNSDKKEKKKKKVKGAKEGKLLYNPEEMEREELELHHHRRRQRTSKLVTTMARAILNPDQNKFTIGTIGSSVAAGHDNCHYDAYESQLERTLTPIFAMAHMGVEVQNAGEGGGCGDSHQNQVFCITHNVSPDVDVVHYSWTYFEKETPEVQREQLVRWAQRMERRPMVHHLIARGKRNTCGGDNRPNVDLANAYAPYAYNAFCIQTGLYFGGHDYDAENEAGVNRFGWKHRGDGYHNTTRYGEELPEDDPRRASLGVVYRNWHPGPLGFQVASDAFAYVYVRGLMMALDIIEKDMDAGVDLLDRWFDKDDRRLYAIPERNHTTRQLRTAASSPSSHSDPSIQRQLTQLPPLGDMPEPLFCDPLYCSTPHPPFCTNYEKPTFGTPGVTLKDQSGWTISVDPNKWNHMVGKMDIAIIKAMHDPEMERQCAHLDACGGILAQDSTQGTLTYELPSSEMTAGLVMVCGIGSGKNVGDSMFLQNQNLTITLNDQVLDKSKMDVYPLKKCVRVLKRFGEIDGYEKGQPMLLSFDMADQDPNLAYEAKPPDVKISHLVAL